MARFSQAEWDGPVPNRTVGQIVHPVMGLVLHIEQGREAGTNAWFHNPASQVSAHFGVSKTGLLQQWVDTDDKAWAIGAGNRLWISVENEGFAGDVLTAEQIDADAKVLAWLHVTDDVPLLTTDEPSTRGLGWHGMGGEAWGHPDCPGPRIVAQRAQIIEKAKTYGGLAQSWAGAPTPTPANWFAGAHPMLREGADGTAVAHARALLGIRGEGAFDGAMSAAVKTFQSRNALDIDGVIGPDTWSHLHPVLRSGATGPVVTEVQRALAIAESGTYDAQTVAAVRASQARHQIAVDGVIGPLTYATFFVA
ncbi:MAG TPA: peptidoglycan-binding domain-containing protein [Candidatus Limnocylindria bacterium]|jgi:peptidoglycan hydrolase-like protein with peptidoglycan-binding domain|nr:peptidoglycan-binding domain-containing protein [Candidatus Limnocylindria bacterium]